MPHLSALLPAVSGLVTTFLLSAMLCACGGGGNGDSTVPPPADSVLTPANRWSGAIPQNALATTDDALREAVASGHWRLAGPAADEAVAAERRQALDADIAYLRANASENPAAKELLAQQVAARNPLAEGELAVPGLGRTVGVSGPASALHAFASAHRASQQPDNALALYRTLHALLADEVRANLPTPDSLAGQPLEAINGARADADSRLAAWQTTHGAARSTQPRPIAVPRSGVTLTERVRAQALEPGAGSDGDGPCAPTHLAARYWFPLQAFLPSVKDQGRRNTCWSFAVAGALELRERVQADRTVDLSEQFLINKVRLTWFPNSLVESGGVLDVMNEAVRQGQVLPPESVWTYNPSLRRTAISEFKNLCDPYGLGPNKGSCSDSSHQSPMHCTDGRFGTFCAYELIDYRGAGTTVSPARTLWTRGADFALATYAELLAQGVPLLAEMQVHPGFANVRSDGDAPGVVSDFSTTRVDAQGRTVSSSSGQHAVVLVGFLSNDQLAAVGQPSDVPGGGYFIVRNSWGCGFGDAGYAYLPVAYAQQVFDAITQPVFDASRSSAWAAEQAAPGGSIPPTVAGLVNASADLRVERDLAALISVSHPVARTVHMVIRSDVEGLLYDGPWITDRAVLGGTRVPHTFTAKGRHLLGFTASYGGQSVRAGVAVDVVNTAPTLRLLAGGDARQGEPYAIMAQALDINEGDAGGLCSRARWTVAPPDTLPDFSGCSQSVTFGEAGTRTVSVVTSDSEGLVAAALLSVNVLPPLANPYPRINAAQVLSRQTAGVLNACQDVAMANGETIDLRQSGCISEAVQSAPPRYSARADVDNPSGEALGYEWTLFVSRNGIETDLYGGPIGPAGPTVRLLSPGFQTLVTNDCRLAVTVRAPQAERTKSRTVWTGRCTYLLGGTR